ncbi:STAS domain-containing protein [Leeia sp. TBRC 13508]|uniref:STAS domain-containing protein n=1 Tax=Leeia speluncae TaxID=2884804 RepID=A0ABS8D3H8_9NEIS|nr:STAS domain-containing protein [Leeia speluncae]MCB6182759.1 STAS domain-containing protein [Leeia speluncae]
MQASCSFNGPVAVVSLTGRFDFNSHRVFREAIDKGLAEPNVRQLTIDFKSVDYIDSSALGMLMLLKEKADMARKQVTLSNCSGVARQVLDIANFSKLFTME